MTLDGGNLLRYAIDDTTKPTLVIPRTLVPGLLALIRHLHKHPGVASTVALTREGFHWPTVVRDLPEYDLSCGCRKCRRSSSQQLELEVDLLCVDTISLGGSEYIILAVGIEIPLLISNT